MSGPTHGNRSSCSATTGTPSVSLAHPTTLVSIVIPARTWDQYLESTLSSIRRQKLPNGLLVETIIGLADSTAPDPTDDVVTVANPSGNIPDALNLAVAQARGEIIIRVDSRCDLPCTYIARVVERLADPSLGCVGGAALVLDRGMFGSAYAVAFNSPMLGPSSYRYRPRSGPVDTAYLGAWRVSVLRELGGFDPRLIRNQDNELAERVRASGRIVYYDADLVVGYWNGRGLRSTVAHHYEFGLWRMYQSSAGQQGLTRKHIVALVIGSLSAVTVSSTLFRTSARRATLAALTTGYLAAVGLGYRSATRLRRRRRDLDIAPLNPIGVVLAPTLAALINAAWIAGVLRGAAGAGALPSAVSRPAPRPQG